MKALKSILAVALGLICTGALAQTTLKEAVAPGNKVYVEIDNDDDHPIPQDEIEDVTREFAAAGAWVCVSEASPRTWLTPSVLDKEGNELWESKTYKADATMFNGYRSTNTCISTVIEKGFQKDLFKKAGR